MMFSNFTTFMVFLCVSRHAYAPESAKSATDCIEYRSCTKCANEKSCIWSLEHQKCVELQSYKLMVKNKTDCPQFTLAKLSGQKDEVYTYTLAVSNDKGGFMKYLRNVTIGCSVQTAHLKGQVDNNNNIKCDGIRRTQADFQLNKQMNYFYNVKFNNNSVILRLENDLDYYVPHYDHDCGVMRDADCLTCAWTADGYINYFKRCSSTNRCTGLYQFYNRRHVQNFAVTAATAVLLQCANASVQSVEPVSAPWTGGTVVHVTVKNHWILSENKSVTVTVAGRQCVDPRSVDNDKIECTVSPPPKEALEVVGDVARHAEGSIVVEYGPLQRFSVASTFAFKLVNPRLTNVSPTCGPISGRTQLTISGEHLDTGNTVRVEVGNNVTCKLVVRAPDRISCLTGETDGSTVGAVRVVFDGNLTARAAKSFTYTGIPLVEQSQYNMVGIVSGGTNVLVRGYNFACASNATMIVQMLKKDATIYRAGCEIQNDTVMVCRSPAITRTEEKTPPDEMNFQLDIAYDGGPIEKPQPKRGDGMPAYKLHPDPVVDDFVMNGHNVTIIGRDLNWEFAQYEGDSMVVRLLVNDSSAVYTVCDVKSIYWNQIVCVPRSAGNLDAVSAVNITFGMSVTLTHRRPVSDNRPSSTDVDDNRRPSPTDVDDDPSQFPTDIDDDPSQFPTDVDDDPSQFPTDIDDDPSPSPTDVDDDPFPDIGGIPVQIPLALLVFVCLVVLLLCIRKKKKQRKRKYYSFASIIKYHNMRN